MSEHPSDDRLERLLRDLPAPNPSPAFLVNAHRRFQSATTARARREALAGLMAALLGLAVLGGLVTTFSEPGASVAWLAETTADLTRWTTGAAVVVSLVPLTAWALAAAGSLGTLLSLALLTRARAAPAK